MQTISNPNGLYYKNHLFYIDGTKCYYNGEEVSGLTVTDGKKQLVGMGAYICIFPDKKIFNTATGEITTIDASYSQSGAITFRELTADSVFCKIIASGIDDAFKLHDGVKIDGVNDSAFLLDGDGVTKVITDIGTDYIVVTASIQNSFTGAIQIQANGSNTRISGSGINKKFDVNDQIKIVGCSDDALNVSDKTVTLTGSDYIVINSAFPAKSYTQSAELNIAPYYAGSDQTKIYGTDLNTIFSKGDIVTISGCSNAAVNGSWQITGAGTDYILIGLTLTNSLTQASGIRITRTAAKYDGITVKRTAFTRSSGITFSRNSQNFDFVCEHDNRLWACNSLNHEIYASKLGDPTNWNCYEGISTDSYTVTVGSDGDFTGCVSHMGYVLFFKENYIHMMYGAKPTNYQLNTKQMPGVRAGCAESLEVVKETLFYVGRNGVYQFDGAFPTKISDGISSEIKEAAACQQDGRYYLSCLKDNVQTLLVYDPEYQIWDVEDGTKFKYSVYGDGTLYYIDSSNNLTTITGNRDELIEWAAESGYIVASSLDEKYISKIKLNFSLEAGAEANIYLRYDDEPLWERKGTVYSINRTTYTLPIIPKRCNSFHWKMEGKGQMKLLAMAYTVEGGSELNGYIQSAFRR